jgi:hypothetical protein
LKSALCVFHVCQYQDLAERTKLVSLLFFLSSRQLFARAPQNGGPGGSQLASRHFRWDCGGSKTQFCEQRYKEQSAAIERGLHGCWCPRTL